MISEQYPRYGYRRIAVLLGQEGWQVGKRQVQRMRRAAGLRVPPTRRKRHRQGVSTGLPTKATHKCHVWTWDFIADATVRGGALRMLTILDEYTRECHVLRAERALRAADVLAWLAKRSRSTELQNTYGQTTGRSSLPGKCSAGWRTIILKRFILILAVRGKTVLWKAFTVVFEMNA